MKKLKLFYFSYGQEVNYLVMETSETKSKEAIQQKIKARWEEEQNIRHNYFNEFPEGYQHALAKYQEELATINKCSIKVLKTGEVIEL